MIRSTGQLRSDLLKSFEIALSAHILQNRINMNEQTEKKVPPEVKISEILALIEQGYSRYTEDDKGYGNIQTKYGLSKTEVKEIFSHPKLKGIKMRTPKVKVVDDTTPSTPETSLGNDLFR